MRNGWRLLAGVTTLGMAAALALLVVMLVRGPGDEAGGGQPGPSETIQIHGHWTIEVREPDGRLVSRREFANALTASGGELLRDILLRKNLLMAGLWRVDLVNTSGGLAPCADALGQSLRCLIVENDSGMTGSNVFKTLTVTAPTSGPNSGKLALLGTATATVTTTINRVMTLVGTCDVQRLLKEFFGATCKGESSIIFTLADLSQPVSVSAGQQLNVTVFLSAS